MICLYDAYNFAKPFLLSHLVLMILWRHKFRIRIQTSDLPNVIATRPDEVGLEQNI